MKPTYLATQELAIVIDDNSCKESQVSTNSFQRSWTEFTFPLWRLAFQPLNIHNACPHPRMLHKGGVDCRRSEFF